MIKKLLIRVILVIGLFMMLSMTACAPKQRGTFYTLEEAYKQGLLTQDDLKSIAHYQNGESAEEDFEPMPKNPEELSKKTEKAIKETKAYELRNQDTKPIKEAKAKDIIIRKYYGTYNDCVAVMLDDMFGGFIDIERMVIVAGVSFYYRASYNIMIWKEK